MNNQKAFVGWVPHLYPRGGNVSAWVKTAFTHPTKNKVRPTYLCYCKDEGVGGF